MHLVVNQVVELEHVHVADGHRPVKGLPGAAVVQDGLAAFGQPGEPQHLLDFRFRRAVEHRRGDGQTVAQVAGQLQYFGIRKPGEVDLALTDGVVHLIEVGANLPDLALLVKQGIDLIADALGSPAEVGLEHLADVHAGRHAQWIEDDVHRLAVVIKGHVLNRHDDRNHALVAVPPGHLVARLNAALDGQVNLDDLEHARVEVVAAFQFRALVLENLLQALGAGLQLLFRAFDLLV